MKGIEDDDVQAYYQYMVKIAILLGAEPEQARKELREALEFEILLSNVRFSSFPKLLMNLFCGKSPNRPYTGSLRT